MDKKDIRITIRLSLADVTTLEASMSEAGYKSAGAFIRDFVARNNLKPKISASTVSVARELGTLAAMIRTNAPSNDLLEEIRIIAIVNAAGAR